MDPDSDWDSLLLDATNQWLNQRRPARPQLLQHSANRLRPQSDSDSDSDTLILGAPIAKMKKLSIPIDSIGQEALKEVCGPWCCTIFACSNLREKECTEASLQGQRHRKLLCLRLLRDGKVP